MCPEEARATTARGRGHTMVGDTNWRRAPRGQCSALIVTLPTASTWQGYNQRPNVSSLPSGNVEVGQVREYLIRK